jgi:hypothetical protein
MRHEDKRLQVQPVVQVQSAEQSRYLPYLAPAFLSVVQFNNTFAREASTYSSLLLAVVVQL